MDFMSPNRRGLAAALAATALLVAGTASADEAHRVRGTIESLDGNILTVATREGDTATIMLLDDWMVSGVARASLADVGEGDFVGIASLPTEDGKDGALEVLIFPEEMAGTGEGSYPWDLEEGSTMTNATVADKVASVDGGSVTLSYDGGKTKEIVIPEGTPIVTFADATSDDLIVGARVFVPAHIDADGQIGTTRVVVGHNGVVPPM